MQTTNRKTHGNGLDFNMASFNRAFPKLFNAISNAIGAKVDLDRALASQIQGTTGKERDALLMACAKHVATCYTDLDDGIVQAYVSRQKGIAFGVLMDDGSYSRTAQSDAARKWFGRNILKSGFISLPAKASNKADPVSRLIKNGEKLTASQRTRIARAWGLI